MSRISMEPNLEEQEILADTKRRADERLRRRELLCETGFDLAFFAAVAAVWWRQPPGDFALLPALLCFGVLIVALHVQFDTPFGFTVATQLAFVPMLFAMPIALVPLAVAAALVLCRIPAVVREGVPIQRLLRSPANAWFALGPVAVFAIAHTLPDRAGAVLLIVALVSQIGLDIGVSTLRHWLERGASIAAQVRELWVYMIDVALSVVGLVVAEDIHRHGIVALAPLPLLALLGLFARERTERIESLLELSTAYRGTALVLGDVIEADDGYTGEHSKGVVRLAVDVALRLELSAERRRNVEFAALLHDVGKIAIPKEIINKPGKLTHEEWKVIETHTLEGQKMLDRIGGFMQSVGRIVRSHHERWDGGGYPDGIAADAIPVEARIITACDSWNAMRTDRSYRKALPYEQAVTEMRTNAGRQFDPAVVDALLAIVAELEGPAEPAPDAARAAPDATPAAPDAAPAAPDAAPAAPDATPAGAAGLAHAA